MQSVGFKSFFFSNLRLLTWRLKYLYRHPEFICHRKNMKLPANNPAPDGKRPPVSQYWVIEINHKLPDTASTGFCCKDLVLWLVGRWNPQLPFGIASKRDGKASPGAELRRSSPEGRDLPLQLDNPPSPFHWCWVKGQGCVVKRCSCQVEKLSGGWEAAADSPWTHRQGSCRDTREGLLLSCPPKPGLFVHLSASLDEGQRAQGTAGHNPQELFWENVLKREKKESFR